MLPCLVWSFSPALGNLGFRVWFHRVKQVKPYLRQPASLSLMWGDKARGFRLYLSIKGDRCLIRCRPTKVHRCSNLHFVLLCKKINKKALKLKVRHFKTLIIVQQWPVSLWWIWGNDTLNLVTLVAALILVRVRCQTFEQKHGNFIHFFIYIQSW